MPNSRLVSRFTVETDEELLSRWRDGDKRSGEQLFDRHFEPLFRFFCSKAEPVAEDLTQETLLACVKGKERIRFEHRFRAYMFAVARRILYAYYDRLHQGRDVELGSRSVIDLSPVATEIVAKRQEERLFLEALRSLPLDHQIAIELHFWEELTGPEIAAVLDVPEGTIRSRLRRARLQLEQKVREYSKSPRVIDSTMTHLDTWAANVRKLLVHRPSE